MPPIVSVVVPVYNSGAWIGETLDSVFRQTLPHEQLELIVVDDGSTDDGAAIARSAIADHPMASRVVVRPRNKGVGAARNVGWTLATGEWIQFLDADDLLEPRKIELQLAWALQLPGDVAVVYSPWQHFGLRDGHWQPYGTVMSSSVDDDTTPRILVDRHFGYVGPTLIRRSFLQAVSGFDEGLNLGEDLDLMLRLALGGGRFSRVPHDGALFFYRQRKGSLWRQAIGSVDSMRNLADVARRAELALRGRNADDLPAELRRALAERYTFALDLLFEHDREHFRTVLEWIRGLGLRYPPDPRRTVRMLAPVVGYETTQRLLFSYRQSRRRWRALMGR